MRKIEKIFVLIYSQKLEIPKLAKIWKQLNYKLYILTNLLRKYNELIHIKGEMAERLKAPVLKTGNGATRS